MGEGDPAARRVEQIEAHYLGLAQLFERSPDAVIVAEAGSGRVVLWNPGATRLFGYSSDEATGLLTEDLVPDELKERHRAGMARYARTGEGPLLQDLHPIELPAVTKGGRRVQVELTLSPIDNGARLAGRYVLAIIRDVTERFRAEEERRRLEAERSAFVANAAHELRTPLTSIYGYLSLLADRRHELSEEELDECFSTLKRTGERVNALIASLLDLEQIEHGPPQVELETVDLRRAVETALEISPPPAGFSLELEVPSSLPVLVDPNKLHQILINLLTNAYRYGERGVTVAGASEGDRVILSVTDDGAGVPDDLLPHLFEPFMRGDNARRTQGSGLGLAITRRLVEMLGAEISYEHAAPGARFVVRLRRGDADTTTST